MDNKEKITIGSGMATMLAIACMSAVTATHTAVPPTAQHPPRLTEHTLTDLPIRSHVDRTAVASTASLLVQQRLPHPSDPALDLLVESLGTGGTTPWRLRTTLRDASTMIHGLPVDRELLVSIAVDEVLVCQRRIVATRAHGATPSATIDLRDQQAEEGRAVARLRHLWTAQEQFRAQRIVDRNADRIGEYGFAYELRRSKLLPTNSNNHRQLEPVGGSSIEFVAGYCYSIFLPTYPDPGTPTQAGLAAAEAGRGRHRIEPIAGATCWVCYAWPAANGRSTLRTFAIDQTGVVRVLDVRAGNSHVGPGRAPRFDAARGQAGNLLCGLSEGGVSADGQKWFRHRAAVLDGLRSLPQTAALTR